MYSRTVKRLALCLVLLLTGWAATAGDVHADANGAPWIISIDDYFAGGCWWVITRLSNGDRFDHLMGCNYNG